VFHRSFYSIIVLTIFIHVAFIDVVDLGSFLVFSLKNLLSAIGDHNLSLIRFFLVVLIS
jgi:hypothetical protein